MSVCSSYFRERGGVVDDFVIIIAPPSDIFSNAHPIEEEDG